MFYSALQALVFFFFLLAGMTDVAVHIPLLMDVCLGMYLEAGLLHHKVTLCLGLGGNCQTAL